MDSFERRKHNDNSNLFTQFHDIESEMTTRHQKDLEDKEKIVLANFDKCKLLFPFNRDSLFNREMKVLKYCIIIFHFGFQDLPSHNPIAWIDRAAATAGQRTASDRQSVVHFITASNTKGTETSGRDLHVWPAVAAISTWRMVYFTCWAQCGNRSESAKNCKIPFLAIR